MMFCGWLLIGSISLGAMVVMNPAWNGPSTPLMLWTMWLPALSLSLLQAHRIACTCLALLMMPVWVALRTIDGLKAISRSDHPPAVRKS